MIIFGCLYFRKFVHYLTKFGIEVFPDVAQSWTLQSGREHGHQVPAKEKISYQIEKMGAVTCTDHGVVFVRWTMNAVRNLYLLGDSLPMSHSLCALRFRIMYSTEVCSMNISTQACIIGNRVKYSYSEWY